MNETTCVNLKHDHYDVYIGRDMPGFKPVDPEVRFIWGNPFAEHVDGPDGACRDFELLMRMRLGLTNYEGVPRNAVERYFALNDFHPPSWWRSKLRNLAGKKLGCWCKPMPCHGDVLVKLIKEIGES